MKYVVGILISLSAGYFACTASSADGNIPPKPNSTRTERSENVAEAESTPLLNPGFPDFRNFNFPKYCLEVDHEPFLLQNGNFEDKRRGLAITFGSVAYTDLTGDGVDEAIVVLDIITGGSSMPNCVYIFSQQDAKGQKITDLWDFETGDRADGGLRGIYEENGNMIFETYSPEDNLGACCPRYYVRETYKWENGKFRKEAEEKRENPIRGTEMKVGNP